jgi:hypothetical protein
MERLGEYAKETYGLEIEKVTSWNDETIYEGYCETCAYETVGLRIYYVNSKGENASYLIRESFSDIVRYF